MSTATILRSVLGGAVAMLLTMLGVKLHVDSWGIGVLACVGIVIFTTICVTPRAIEIVIRQASGWRKAGVASVASIALTAGAPIVVVAGALVALTAGAFAAISLGALFLMPLALSL